ncbi:HtaA domain-containing protein [Enteractinococcus coprophilus]|uniref:Htaa protein n=1 Tax=Enteractinococcus coprophilus TaxID=1027633 RepID=A0A543AG12_9MICC|nr:HtaA domain-containing protein [Enteractinococcus coprophilus]TQL71525.1 Htaa protein [Enteractinococcus coprophilus]
MNDNTLFARIDRIAGLAWGVHRPFREYIHRLADGHVAVHDGAQMLESGETLFPLDVESAAPRELPFAGSLEFRGHQGMMAVTVAHPRLQREGERWWLTIADPFEPGARMSIVEVVFQDDATGITRLTESGTDLFMGNYTDSTVFDPIRIVWKEKDAHK